MLNLKNPAERAEWIYGQPMTPCPACGSYNMKPQMPVKIGLADDDTAMQALGKLARAMKSGTVVLEGPCYYACGDCGHKGPSVDCTGRTSEECRGDRFLNDEMKRLWNTHSPTPLLTRESA